MLDELARILSETPGVRFALLFGSRAKGRERPDSDVDIAVDFEERLSNAALGALLASLERAAGRPVDLLELDRAGPYLAWRVFREGRELYVRDRGALVERRARAILDYLDWKPIEERLVAGVLRRAAHG